MRVVMAAACPYPTTQGTQVAIRGLTRAMVERGHEVHVVAYHFGEDLPSVGEILHRTPPLSGYRKLRAGPAWSKPVLDGLLLATLLRVVRRVRPDLIHAHNYEAPLAAYAVRVITGVPVLYNSHNLMQDELHRYFERPWARAIARGGARLLDGSVPRAADRVVVLSEAAVEAHVARGVRRDRIDVLPPGIHPDEFPDEPSPQGAPTVLYMGNPDAYQDLPILFEAFARVAEAQPDARLRFVSSADLGPTRAVAVRCGVPADRAEFLTEPRWDRVRALAQAAHVAAIPRTVCRGFPIKLLNGMALGLPTVACRGGGPLIEDGVTGLLVDDGDVAGFAEALSSLLADPARAHRMGKQARSSVLASETWAHRAPDLERIWGDVAAIAACTG
ncbi:MAG: glycosyltransferase family 4 protein [Proteobacteria bacterium]|nr:glycosyltransferase family 4 protein [Pseudomonadota bacterium]